MTKVGVVTLGGYHNYGNRLQNAALIYALKNKMSVDAFTIVNWGNSKKIYNITRLRNIVGFIKKIGFNYFIQKKRLNEFINFSNLFSNEYKSRKNLTKYEIPFDDFDYIVVGSDQVWANWLTPKEMEYFMLSSVPSIKRIAYAASMGNPNLRVDSEFIFDREIKKFTKISVREKAAEDYIESKIEKKVPVVLDPTMLLSQQNWLELLDGLENPFVNKSKYIFTYFLSKPSKKMKKIMKDLKKEGYSFINFNSKVPMSRKYYGLGPEDFVFAISNSEGVLTDSFHASVFSILFEKPFYIDPNRFGGSMSARIDTLLDSTELGSKRLRLESDLEDFWNTDYSNALINLKKLRLKSLDYLNKSLES